jgi:DNA-binding GntR family transcriptional regulator
MTGAHATPPPSAPANLGARVTAELRELILSGTFAPGQRLVETELATRFATSRGPVRDAFAELERTGLVSDAGRRGTFVAELTAADMDELYSLRTALEELAVVRAVERADGSDLAAMAQALDELAAGARSDDPRAVGDADMRFHRSIVAAAGHRRLEEAWEGLADQTLLVMSELPEIVPHIQSDPGQHRDVFDAIVARDAVRAVAAIRRHLHAARAVMVDHREDRVDR